MNDIRDTWWFVAIAVLLIGGLVAAFIPGYRPLAFIGGVGALMVYAFWARGRARRGGS